MGSETGMVLCLKLIIILYAVYLASIVVARLRTLDSRCYNNLHCYYMSQITRGLHWPHYTCNNLNQDQYNCNGLG